MVDAYDESSEQTYYVISSAVHVPGSGPETYLFTADEEGVILNWSELEGSFRGDINHERAVTDAGWEIDDEYVQERWEWEHG